MKKACTTQCKGEKPRPVKVNMLRYFTDQKTNLRRTRFQSKKNQARALSWNKQANRRLAVPESHQTAKDEVMKENQNGNRRDANATWTKKP